MHAAEQMFRKNCRRHCTFLRRQLEGIDVPAAELDARVSELVAAGAEESAARAVVRKAVRFGQGDRGLS